MPDDLDEFVAQGIVHYVDARQAVSAFDDEMLTRLDRYRRSRRKWDPLSNIVYERSQPSGAADRGWWLSAGVRGRHPRYPVVRVDMGLWFGVPEHPAPIVYASLFKEPTELLGFEYGGDIPGVSAFSRWGMTVLFAPLTTPRFETSLDLVVGGVLKHIK